MLKEIAFRVGYKLFTDDAKRIGFYMPMTKVLEIVAGKKYRKYVNRQAGSTHVALLAAFAGVGFSSNRTFVV